MHARGMPAGLLLLAVFAAAAADAGSQERLQRTWTFPAAQFADVEVKLVRGDVVVRRSNDSHVRVRISVSGQSNVAMVPAVQRGQAGNSLRIEISRGSVNLSRWNPRRAPALSDR